MTQAVLIRNADLYAPEHVGMRDILIAGGKIIAVEPHLENVNIPGMETVDAAGRRVTPGLIDQHIHVTGGGGEGGWASRCPELNFSSLVKGGVTSFMGVSGTDSMSRSIENLLAKVRGLTVEGASGWMWTSNYAYPPATITGSVKGDLFAIPECWGVKIAMGDHRSSFPTDQEVLRLLSEIRVAGMLTGKTGFLHVHCGDWGDAIFDPLEAAIPKGIPAKHMRPTHVARHPQVFERACRFAKMGGFIDITTGGGCWDPLQTRLSRRSKRMFRSTVSRFLRTVRVRCRALTKPARWWALALAPLTATWRRCALPPKRLVLTKRSVR